MNIVLDTNVLISALVATAGVSSKVVKHCVATHTVITSEFILNELREKLVTKFKRSESNARQVIELFQNSFIVVEPVTLAEKFSRDADDDQILATALAGNAECILTGDKDLLVLKVFRGIKIIAPSELTAFEQSKKSD